MKQFIIQIGIGLLLVLTACQSDVVSGQPGEKVTLSFDLYQAELTKAENMASQNMPAGKKFRAYAYEQGTATTGTPNASGIYTVGEGGSATGNLTLYRGVYDIYLVSYYDETYVPELGSNNLISVENNKDFMYTVLKNVTVQPTPGNNQMSVQVTDPFTRLCSNVIVKVKANSTQPIGVHWLTVNSITVNNLSAPLSYQLGEDNLNIDASTGYTENLTFTQFNPESKPEQTTTPKVSTPKVVLPIKGTTPLKFNVNLKVTYNKYGGESGNEAEDFNYEASVRKIFLPGMTYVFEFTLTFFGALDPTDLTLGILEYTTVSDKADNVGE